MSPKKDPSGMTSAMRIAYTGKRAEQVVKGVTKMVINRYFQFSMFRVAITAGMAQAVHEISGMTLLPFNPKRLNPLSIKKTTRLM